MKLFTRTTYFSNCVCRMTYVFRSLIIFGVYSNSKYKLKYMCVKY